jgi:pilus assembly protein Flp/PilA
MEDKKCELLENEVTCNEVTTQEEQKGASMVEYALLVALIAIIAIVALRTVGQQVSDTFSGIASDIDAVR